MKKKSKQLCFTIPITNSTALPVEYVLFADNKQVAQVPLPNWSTLQTEMLALRDKHTDMEGYFRRLQTENDAAVAGLRQADFREFQDVQASMNLSATAFDNLATALSVQAQSTQAGELQQFGREVALMPILVTEVTLTTTNLDQISQLYTYEKSLVLRAGKSQNLDFYSQYSNYFTIPKVTLKREHLEGGLKFDGITGLRFTVLPNTSLSLKFCYEYAPPVVCCTPKPEKPLPARVGKDNTRPLPAPQPTKELPKPQSAPEKPKPKTPKAMYWLVPLLLLLLVVFVVWFVLAQKEK